MKKLKLPQSKRKDADRTPQHHFSAAKLAYMAFLCVTMSLVFCQPAFAATDVWSKAKEIMQDVYKQIVAISTIAANAFSPADSEAPVLNSETAIVENANDITFTINSILGEALDDVMARIEEDFASSGVDHMEIKNSYSSGPVFNANLIISQYCAARDEDFESISLDDLAAVLRDNKEHLYSYTSVQESREVTTEDPETGEETTTRIAF